MHAERVERARAAMARAGIDLMVIGPSADMHYLIGRKTPATERLSVLVVPARGGPSVLVPKLQAPLVADLPVAAERLSWTESEDPIARLADLIRAARAETVAVDSHLWSGFLLRLQAALPALRWREGNEVLAPLRRIKSGAEIDLLRAANRRFDDIWREFTTEFRLIGATEREVMLALRRMMQARGAEDIPWCDVGSGPNGASPLHHWSDRRIEPGDPVVIDYAAAFGGYYADTCRTPVAGDPNPEFVRLYETVQRAQAAAGAAVRPGVPAQEIDRTARRIIVEAGHGAHFTHRVGHGIGLSPHEQPYLVEGNAAPLEPGNAFSNEPGIYVPGRWGVRIEDIFAVTATGGEVFTEFSRDLIAMR